ncbi:MAG TPA: precorrin-6y C5,15-methyltransferase (decarboxylating) subunit CbiE, partial [Clostridiaceae bacterium]|nr:precorrin-6y C5,15-methyltransferase (decarboxylating) subunit CbiE [Clostridiaceae bacterium]
MKKYRLAFIGMGPGGADWITPAAWQQIAAADYIYASARLQDTVEDALPAFSGFFSLGTKERTWRIFNGRLTTLVEPILDDLERGNVVVLCTGDTGIFSIASWLNRVISERLPQQPIDWLPGISSLQYLSAKLKRSWQNLRIISLHGREPEDLDEVFRSKEPLGIFTDPHHSPHWLATQLIEAGRGEAQMSCGYSLTYPEEEIVTGSVRSFLTSPEEETRLCLVIVSEKTSVEEQTPSPWEKGFAGGMPDHAFQRGNRPMTKSVIRSRLASLL